ncbi:MAG: DUF4838 domain-containing protein [Candidatus Omnitrophota bacterium]
MKNIFGALQKQALLALILFSLSAAVLSAKEMPETLCLADNGQSFAAVIIPADASDKIETAARLLARYVLLSAEADIPIYRDNENSPLAPNIISIHLGRTAYSRKLDLGVEKLDAEGFVIAFPDTRNIVILGASDTGTEFAVYEFLERYLGIRWLFPYDLGEYVPERKTIKIPADEVRQEPAFPLFRFLSGLYGDQSVWAKRNRAGGRVYFHHNLSNLFNPDKYVKSNPEFFPVRAGKRLLPSEATLGPDWKSAYWQPCFSAEGLVEEAIKNICGFFAENPAEISYSLGVNDVGGYCECEKCLAKMGGRTAGGYENHSDVYYGWVNAVVEGVLKRYPDKYFGLLAYREVAEPPSDLKLNHRVIPYITYERLKWADKEREKEGHRATQRWAESAAILGWYDYLYGSVYLVPRVHFHLMADYCRFGYEHGVRALYAEAYPGLWADGPKHWKDGPKLYLSLKLQWNPYLDVDETLKEWYECAVGKEAAPYLAQYFAFWEEFWTKRVIQLGWFQSPDLYLNFNSDVYLKLLTMNDIINCEELLRATVSSAKTEKEKARAQFFLASFEDWKKPVTSRLTDSEQLSQLDGLSRLSKGNLLFAVENYKNWLDNTPPTPYTDSLYLTAGMLMEKAGEQGSWMQAFDSSPWSKSGVKWLKPFVYGLRPDGLEKKVLSIKPTAAPPEIDGILNDGCWGKAAKAGGFREYIGDTIVSQPTFVAVAYDSKNLYLAYLCLESETDKLVTETKEPGGTVWNDDSVEFFAVPAAEADKGDKFYQIIVSAGGLKYDNFANPEYSAKVYIGDFFWTVEMAIPFTSFNGQKPGKGSRWKVNFNRSRQGKDSKMREISGWTFTDGSHQSPDKFGALTFD